MVMKPGTKNVNETGLFVLFAAHRPFTNGISSRISLFFTCTQGGGDVRRHCAQSTV
jgi:hypothetical protein